VHRAPGIPHALCFQGGSFWQTSGAPRRGIANVYLIVIASEAKQSMEQQARKLDCFASLAMTVLAV
jgi:hypothetical protein